MAGTLDAPEKKAKKGPGLKRVKRRVGIRIDMTPMVDIAFLLLIFFMCTTIFRQPQAMEITLPPPDALPTKVTQENVLSLKISQDGIYTWKIGDAEEKEVKIGELKKLLFDKREENILRLHPEAGNIVEQWKDMPEDTVLIKKMEDLSKLVILVKVAESAKYERVVDIMDEIQQAKMSRFSIVSLEESEKREAEMKKALREAHGRGGRR